ncbi:MAG: SDR family NAD(P)-dependent oxidoreductase [Thermoanaerobaculia bacterium]
MIGASSGLGRAVAEELARTGASLVLVSGDTRDLEPLAADLRVRFARDVETIAVDARDAGKLSSSLATAGDKPLDALLLPIGTVDDDDSPVLEMGSGAELFAVNFFAPVAAIQTLLPALRQGSRPVIVGFGSIAEVRGRSRNTFYSAAKRALQTYFESLQHQLTSDGFTVRYYILGYLDTNLAFGRKLPFRPASPHAVAKRIVADLHASGGVAYLPRYWYVVATILRWLPWSLFRRVKA